MFLEPYPNRDPDDGMKVWLEQRDLDRFIDEAKDTEQRIAFHLMGYSGLRSAEVLRVAHDHITHTSAGPRVRIYKSKGRPLRETIASDEFVTLADTLLDVGGRTPTEALVTAESTRTLRRWVARARERLQDDTGDDGWQYLSPHDLRGTWATLMVQDYDVDPILVCNWGGWEHLETFLDHYRGAYSASVQRRELDRVPWVSIDDRESSSISEDPVEIGRISAN